MPPGVGTHAASPVPPTQERLHSSPPARLDTATRTGRRTQHGKTAECPKNKYVVEVSPSEQRFQLNQDLRHANRSGHVGRPGRFLQALALPGGPTSRTLAPELPLPTTGHTGGGVSTEGQLPAGGHRQPGSAVLGQKAPNMQTGHSSYASCLLGTAVSLLARSSVHTRWPTAPLKCVSVSQAAQVLCLTRSALGDEGPGRRAPCSRHQAAGTAAPDGTTDSRGNETQRDSASVLNRKLTSSPRQAGGPLSPPWELNLRPGPPGDTGQTVEED